MRTDDRALSMELIEQFSADFGSVPANRIAMNAVTKSGVNAVATDRAAGIDMQFAFSEEIATGPVTNQKQSGRCWLFAGLNTIRSDIAKRNNMEPFELSQSYQMFWDKFEKANYFLERIFDTIEEDTDSRIVQWLLQSPLQDGGQWDMFVNLVEKHGVVPQSVMPETFHSSKSYLMNRLLTKKLRKYASDSRRAFRSGTTIEDLREQKLTWMGEFYRLLCTFLGEPPSSFDFEYRDKDGEFHRHTDLSPLDFFQKFFGDDLRSYVSIINAPTADKPFGKTYTVKYLGNVEGGRNVFYLNVDIETVKQVALAQIKAGEPVWFGCDVGQMSDSEAGIMDTDLFDYEGALNTTFAMTKAERLDYGESLMTHAMVFTGANVVGERVNRWKVENSWGKDRGKDGFFVMSDAWFNDYMYQVVVHRKYLPAELDAALNQDPVLLNPWDPMGSLAMMR
ncbi:C1 family peptidase [Alicyclobacillus dauci]|uniref:Aminopeptidase n=1 Tax=Alicyclobacillus dauci TaxID=1475485 RepID=A0ABY6Z8D6_9BACL|nr:C1 family peptidase [Alicyclobacillus dauci]WAH39092.1 C1 family peptidase [Alicyclobacillus dauci]